MSIDIKIQVQTDIVTQSLHSIMDTKSMVSSTHDVEDFHMEEGLLLNETIRVLSSVGQNLYGLLSDFSTPPAFLSCEAELATLQKETQTLRENIEYLVNTQLFSTRQAMSNAQSEMDELLKKYKNLQNEWDGQQEHLGRMQNEVYKLRNQLQHQSQFCASLGAVMGNLVWKSSRIPAVVDLLLGGNKVGDFLCIVNGTLVSFMETYASHMPNQSADESQFITSMCGIVTNLAAAPSGRQFLVSNNNGLDLTDQFIRVLPKIPSPSGNCLKRLILMALYNLSINQSGLKYLQENTGVLQAISHSFQKDTTHELKLMSLRLLQSITFDVACPDMLKEIERIVPLAIVDDMSRGTEMDMKIVAKDVLDNLDRARKVVKALAAAGEAQGSCSGQGCSKSGSMQYGGNFFLPPDGDGQ